MAKYSYERVPWLDVITAYHTVVFAAAEERPINVGARQSPISTVLVEPDRQIGMRVTIVFDKLGGSVRGAVIDHQNLVTKRKFAHRCRNRVQRPNYVLFLIKARHHDSKVDRVFSDRANIVKGFGCCSLRGLGSFDLLIDKPVIWIHPQMEPLSHNPPVVIASVAGVGKQLQPSVDVEQGLGRKNPFLHRPPFLVRAISIYHNEGILLREALNLSQTPAAIIVR